MSVRLLSPATLRPFSPLSRKPGPRSSFPPPCRVISPRCCSLSLQNSKPQFPSNSRSPLLRPSPPSSSAVHCTNYIESERSGALEKGIFDQMREIVVFAGPAVGLWICGPLMSLIDTMVIGQSSSLELAALGKCVTRSSLGLIFGSFLI
jgi:hypothetical protein